MPGTVVVRLDDAALRHLTHSPAGPVVQDLGRRARRVETRAKILCPVDYGRLRSSITHEFVIVNGQPAVRIGTNVDYALLVHNGTGIYGPRRAPIVPRVATVLSWKPRGGQRVYARSVKGTPGRPYLLNALPAAAQ